jgi:transposase
LPQSQVLCIRTGSSGCVNGAQALVIDIEPRKNGKVYCSECGKVAPGYDRLSDVRLYQFIPLWEYQVYFRYRKRRVNCPRCGVKSEQVPWSQGKQRLTHAYQQYLAAWAKRLSWQEVTRAFQTTWDHVYRSVRRVVEYGLAQRNLTLMINWFKAKKMYSSGAVEGLNRKVNLVTRKAYDYKSYDVLKIALFHTMGCLPEPKMTHKFF